jgi:hypothetical protein
MRKEYLIGSICTAKLGTVLLLASIAIGGAPAYAALTEGSIPAMPATKKITWAEVAKWPDFTTGLWVSEGIPGGPGAPGDPPGAGGPGSGPAAGASNQLGGAPLKPEVAARAKKAMALQANGGASCEPTGLPARDIGFFSPRFYYAKDVIIIGAWSDWYNGWRRIYMNRTEHGDPEPSYFGDSVGHWEGNTLVIDTVGIRAEAQIVRGLALDSNATHVVERIRLLDANTLEWKKTVENPEILTGPWTTTITKKRKTDEEFPEAFCWRDLESGLAE